MTGSPSRAWRQAQNGEPADLLGQHRSEVRRHVLGDEDRTGEGAGECGEQLQERLRAAGRAADGECVDRVEPRPRPRTRGILLRRALTGPRTRCGLPASPGPGFRRPQHRCRHGGRSLATGRARFASAPQIASSVASSVAKSCRASVSVACGLHTCSEALAARAASVTAAPRRVSD